MAKMKVCRVCGKEYRACANSGSGSTFRWQEVACSPECGQAYLKAIYESRGIAQPQEAAKDYSDNNTMAANDEDESIYFVGGDEEDYEDTYEVDDEEEEDE